MAMSWPGREHLGRVIRNVWVDNIREYYKGLGIEPPVHRILAWEDLTPEIREADMRLGEALFFYGANEMSNHIAALDVWEYVVNEKDVDRAGGYLTSALSKIYNTLYNGPEKD